MHALHTASRRWINQLASDFHDHIRLGVLRPRNLTRWLTTLSLGVSGGMMCLGGAVLLDLRADAWHRSQQTADNLTLALSREIARNINMYDLSLQGTLNALAAPSLMQASPTLRQIALFDHAATARYFGAILVTDGTGDVVADSTSVPPHALNLGIREHFQVQKSRPDAGLYISRPFQGRLEKTSVISLSRRINDATGNFAGIVQGAVRTDYFFDLFADLDIGPKTSVTLFRDDGHIIMRRPFNAGEVDRDLSKTPAFRQLGGARHGHFVDTATLDGVRRLYTFQKVGDLPLYLCIAIAVDEIYAQWWHKAVSIGAILLALSVASVCLSLMFRRELIRRTAAEASMVQAAKRLSLLATTDGLTGIPNRRSFDEAMAREWRRAIRVELPVAVLMLDVDYFKRYNDQYGHPAGDATLRTVAGCIADNVRRPGDMVFRYGGEEFIALLPETDAHGAQIVAEAIRTALAALGIPHAGSPFGTLTGSVGAAVAHPVQGDLAESLIKAADNALYGAKRAGRNRVMMQPQLALPPVAFGGVFLAGS